MRKTTENIAEISAIQLFTGRNHNFNAFHRIEIRFLFIVYMKGTLFDPVFLYNNTTQEYINFLVIFSLRYLLKPIDNKINKQILIATEFMCFASTLTFIE